MRRVLKQSTTANLSVFITSSTDHVAGATGLTLTITASKDGAAFASISPVVTELGSGWYALALTTTHTNTLGDLALHITATGADPTDLCCHVVAYDFADAVRLGLSALPNATAGANAGLPTVDANLEVKASTLRTNNDKTGYALTAGEHTTIGSDVQTGLTAQGYTTTRAGYLDTLNGLVANIWGAATSGLTVAGSIGKRIVDFVTTLVYSAPPSAATIATTVRDVDNTSPAAGSLGAKVNSAASAGDPWATALPGSYGAGSAGNIVGANLDAAVSSRNAVAPDNASITGIKAKTDLIPAAGPPDAAHYTNARGDALAHLDADISSRSAPGTAQTVDLTTALNTGQTGDTVGGALLAARAQGFGKWTIVGTTLTLYAADGVTAVRTFALDSASAPTSRT